MTIRSETDSLIEFLNSLVAIDPYAMAELLIDRVPCNEAMARHPTVQVQSGDEIAEVNLRTRRTTFIAPGTFRVGMLGILNGYCGTIDDGPRKGWGPIAAVYDEGRLLRFERTDKQEEKRDEHS